jgi:DNA-binding beta-propeller fold protein YncE
MMKRFFCSLVLFAVNWTAGYAGTSVYLSPMAMAGTDKQLFIACGSGNRVLCLDLTNHQVSTISVPLPPSGLALSRDHSRLFVTCAAPESEVCVINIRRRKVVGTIPVGHSATAPVLSADGKTLYVCNQFDNEVRGVEVGGESREQKVESRNSQQKGMEETKVEGAGKAESRKQSTESAADRQVRPTVGLGRAGSETGAPGKEVCRIAVGREPVAADITKDGRFLLVANQLPSGRADVENVAATVSVIDLTARTVVKDVQLPNGSGSLKDLRVSPDGRYAAVTHIASSFSRATSKVQFGWMNANALAIIDLSRMEVAFSLLLDEPTRGAANPAGLAWSEDGSILAVAHAGTDEVSLIDFPRLLGSRGVSGMDRATRTQPVLTYISHYEGMDPGLPFLTGARVRVKLPAGDLGPRSLVFVGTKLYVANYYSDTVSVIELLDAGAPADRQVRPTVGESISLGPKVAMDAVRRGDYYFHDGNLCLQGWQSCASCHPGDARVDGFNWDLLNDGIGNPKSTRSLLLAHKTPPAMFLGVRTNAETAVRAGLKFILFTNAPEDVAAPIDAYLKSLKPVPSPHLVHGKLSSAAKRGEALFQHTGCADCHVPGLFTDQKPHDVGTRRTFDGPADKFYTPTLIEVWRTAPYLHDGSAATMRDVLTTRNPAGEHGATKDLSEQELNDLCEYVLSL